MKEGNVKNRAKVGTARFHPEGFVLNKHYEVFLAGRKEG
jgi:hypothetical protein